MPERHEVILRVRAFIQTDLLRDPGLTIAADEPLISSGLLDSFSLAQLAVFVEAEWDIALPDVELTVERMDTLEKIASTVLESAGHA